MKFVVDAHLPPGLCALLQTAGHDALHTHQLTAQNRTTDEVLNALSLEEKRVVVTKDTDFYHWSNCSSVHSPPILATDFGFTSRRLTGGDVLLLSAS